MLDAYEKIEDYWSTQFCNFEQVHLVLLSEAPLFEKERQTYIYNPKVRTTSFFNYNDYAKVFGMYGPSLPTSGKVTVRKPALLNALCERGVLVLDLFPFALNTSTSVSYDKLTPDERTELFRTTSPHYFQPKFSAVLEKATPHTLFAFRYERVRDACDALVRKVMDDHNIDSTCLVSESISGRWGVILHDPLRTIYEKTQPTSSPASHVIKA